MQAGQEGTHHQRRAISGGYPAVWCHTSGDVVGYYHEIIAVLGLAPGPRPALVHNQNRPSRSCFTPRVKKSILLELCVSSLRRGHALLQSVDVERTPSSGSTSSSAAVLRLDALDIDWA